MSTRVLVVDADPALRELIEEWLCDAGYTVAAERPDVVVADLPFSHDRGIELLWSIAGAHADVPIIALSSALLSGIDSHGAVARQLGVASVLAKPLTRDALVSAVRRALRPAATRIPF